MELIGLVVEVGRSSPALTIELRSCSLSLQFDLKLDFDLVFEIELS